jgi:hypothetical protein
VLSDADRQLIEWRCRTTAAEIVYLLDLGEFEAMTRQYTEDAVFLRLGEELHGREQILAAMQERPSGIVTRHHLTTMRFGRVTDDEAEAVVYDTTVFGPQPEEPGPATYTAVGGATFEFHDTYRRTGSEWLVARRDARMIFAPTSRISERTSDQ